MERWVAKVIALLVMFVLPLTMVLLPIKVTNYFLRHGQRGVDILSHLMCFGGGVFLGVYMLHMAPDTRALLNYTLLEPNGITYPVAEIIMAFGFFFMVFLERAVIISQQEPVVVSNYEVTEQQETELSDFNKMKSSAENSSADELGGHQEALLAPQEQNGAHMAMQQSQIVIQTGHSHQGGHSHMHATRSLILLLALSLHHIFEGMSIGLKYDVASVWSLCVAIICHEVVIMFSLGMQLVKAYRSLKKVVAAALACSLMTPIGVAIGLIITETGGEESDTLAIVNGVLQGISTGVFLYVTFFEILMGEMGHEDTTMGKLFSMLLGFTVLALLGMLPESTLPEHRLDFDNSTISNCTCP